MNERIHLKNEEEKQLLRYFNQLYTEFPKAKIMKTESPDFVVKLGRHRKIGLEITKLFLIKNSAETHFVLHFEAEQKEIIESFKNKFHTLYNYHAHFHFSFAANYSEYIDTIENKVNELGERMQEKLNNVESQGYYFYKFKKGELPVWMDSVHLIYHPDDKVSDWVSCEKNVPFENFIESIELIVNQKQEKINLYQKNWMDSYWLLIVADCLNCATNFNINNHLSRWQFKSDFDKIFLFELYDQKIHELKA